MKTKAVQMSRKMSLGGSLLLMFFLCGCNSSLSNTRENIKIENVMTEGMRITFTNDYGTMTVTADKGLKRYYTWEGATRDVTMWPRCKRWHGSLGMYRPERAVHWRSNNGITSGVLEEGQQHFDSVDEALAWIKLSYHSKCIYTSNGLVLGWSKSPDRRLLKVLKVDVWQIYIGGDKLSECQWDADVRVWFYPQNELPDILKEVNKKAVMVGGHKPSGLPGSQDNKIKIEYLTNKQLKEFEKSVKPFLLF
jgi:hypothetical protein